jgi:hypothetical protein
VQTGAIGTDKVGCHRSSTPNTAASRVFPMLRVLIPDALNGPFGTHGSVLTRSIRSVYAGYLPLNRLCEQYAPALASICSACT